MGVELFDRHPRGVTLTAAGEVLRREGRAALDAMAAAERRARRAGAEHRHPLVLVTKAGASADFLPKLLDAFAAEPEGVPVELLLCGPGEQEQYLRDGRADVGLLHLPYDSLAGLQYETLHTHAQVVLLPSGHPLSTRSDVVLADIADVPDLPAPRWPRRSGGYPDGPGPQVHSHEQLVQLIGLGRTLAMLPETVRSQPREGITMVPVVDAPVVTTVIAWPRHSAPPALSALVRTALRV